MKRTFYFIPRNIWFYSKFSRFSLLVRCFMTAIVAITIFSSWFVTMYHVLAAMQNGLLANTEQLYEKKKKLEEAQMRTEQLQVDTARKQAVFDTLILNKQRRQSYIQELVLMLRESGLALEGYTPQSDSIKKWYSQQIIRLTALGSYENIIRFLDAIVLSGLPIVCSYVHMEKQQKGILISCEISCYSFHKEEHGKSI